MHPVDVSLKMKLLVSPTLPDCVELVLIGNVVVGFEGVDQRLTNLLLFKGVEVRLEGQGEGFEGGDISNHCSLLDGDL